MANKGTNQAMSAVDYTLNFYLGAAKKLVQIAYERPKRAGENDKVPLRK